MTNKKYTYQDLISAYLNFQRFKDAHPDLQGYHMILYRRLSAYFHVDFEQPLPGEDWEREALGRLFHATVKYRQEVSTPFTCYIEAPKDIIELYDLYGRRLNELCDQLKEQYFVLLCDLYRRIYGDTGRSITSRALKSQGFDDSKEPDELDYL